MLSRSTNVRNSTWNLANILIYPIAFLAATPFFIDCLGESTFGEWMLINSYIYIVVHVVGFGLPESITAHVARASGLQDKSKLYAYLNAAARLSVLMTVISLLFSLLLYLLLYLDMAFFSPETWKTIIIATLIIAFRFPEMYFLNIFKGKEEYHTAGFFSITTRMISLLAQVMLVYAGFGLLEMFLVVLASLIVSVLSQGFVIFRSLKGFRPALHRRLPESKEVYGYGFWTWLQTVISISAFQLDRFLVAYFLGTATVAYYVLASTIANHLNMAFDAVVAWLLPKVSRLKETAADTLDHFYTVRAFSVGFSLLIIMMLFFVSDPLLNLWLGQEKYTKMVDFFKLFLVFEAFLVLAIVPKFYLNAIRSLAFNTILELLVKSAIVLGMITCFAIFGTASSLIWGQIAALMIAMPVSYFMINKYILRGGIFRETLLTQVPSLLVMISILANDLKWSVLVFICAGAFYWLVYRRDKHFRIELLTE